MDKAQYIEKYQAFIFGLDDVLYPSKDYWLQVYYLFAQFIEYGEQIEGQGIIKFMEETYRNEGPEGIFEKTALKFGLPEKYKLNFDLLQQNARLPLKLLLFAPVLSFMQAIVASGKSVFLAAEGNAAQQLNKIRQMEWNGLEKVLKVYFVDEVENGSLTATIEKIVSEHDLKKDEILLVNEIKDSEDLAYFNTYNYLSVNKL